MLNNILFQQLQSELYYKPGTAGTGMGTNMLTFLSTASDDEDEAVCLAGDDGSDTIGRPVIKYVIVFRHLVNI